MQTDINGWDEFLSAHPDAALLQRSAWGELKSGFGWQAVRVISGSAGAQVLFRKLPGNFSVAYIPKGPVGILPDLLLEIDAICREKKAIFLRIEPDSWEGQAGDHLELIEPLRPAAPFQPRRTILVSLEGSEEDILSRMKQKTRYNIRLAVKKDVIVSASDRVDEFYQLAKTTSTRDAFGVHQLSYYQRFYDLFHPGGDCELFTAYHQGQPLASVFAAKSGRMAYYMYGASSDLERNRMPAYLVQWEAIKWAKAQGCRFYDLWGIPDLDEEQLEAEFMRRETHQGLWGVYRFKRGFGGQMVRSVGAWDKVYNKPLYSFFMLYQKLRGSHDV
jgi:peptidoglycan pentaglycine glycine transferase (the first glycine)